MHPRLSLHQVIMLEAPTGAFLRLCREVGIANAVLASTKLTPDGMDETRVASQPRIEAVNHVFCRDLSRAGDEAGATLLEAIDSAQALGARSVYMLTGGRGTLDWKQAAERFATLVAPARDAAQERGIVLLIENASALYADLHIAHCLADTVRLAEMAEIGVCVDLFFCWADAEIGSLLRRAMPLVGLVQVSDYVLGDRALPARAVPGDGAIPLRRLLSEVLEAGYAGAFDLELLGPRIVAEGVESAARRAGERVSEMLAGLGA